MPWISITSRSNLDSTRSALVWISLLTSFSILFIYSSFSSIFCYNHPNPTSFFSITSPTDTILFSFSLKPYCFNYSIIRLDSMVCSFSTSTECSSTQAMLCHVSGKTSIKSVMPNWSSVAVTSGNLDAAKS